MDAQQASDDLVAAAASAAAPRQGMLWRVALGRARQALEAEGIDPEAAALAAEDALIACALRHRPCSLEEAHALLLAAARRLRPA